MPLQLIDSIVIPWRWEAVNQHQLRSPADRQTGDRRAMRLPKTAMKRSAVEKQPVGTEQSDW